MYKTIKRTVYISLFTVISCSNMSNICKHDNQYKKIKFSYKAPVFTNATIVESSFSEMSYPNAENTALPLTWDMLEDVKYKLKWNAEYQLDFNYPVFGKNIKKYKGKEVDIAGYMIPLDVNGGLYVISRYNYASCFFCGGGGPESIVTLKFKTKPKRYKTDDYLTMKGILELNETNVNEYFYIFKNAEEVK